MIWPAYPRTTPGQRVSTVTIIEPAEPFVTVEDVKAWHLIEHNLWDQTRIPMALRAAHGMIDGPKGIVGRCFGVQTLELAVYDPCATRFDLPYPPVLELVEVTYDDGDNTAQTLDVGSYYLHRGAVVAGSSFPTFNEMRIRYRAGYPVSADSPGVSPPEMSKELETAKMAILLQAGDFLRNTGATIDKDQIVNPAVEYLLAPLRVRAIA